MDWDYHSKLFKMTLDYGMTATIAVVAVGMVIKYFSNKLTTSSKGCATLDLSDHGLFPDLDFLMGIIIPKSLFGSSKGRNKLFRVMMNDVVWVCKDRCSKFAERFPSFESDEAWVQANTDMLVGMVQDYTELWNKHEIPQDAIDLFIKWNGPRTGLIMNEIKLISTSALYETYAEKQASLFEIYRLIMRITLHDGEQTLGVLNGTLSGKLFQGELI